MNFPCLLYFRKLKTNIYFLSPEQQPVLPESRRQSGPDDEHVTSGIYPGRNDLRSVRLRRLLSKAVRQKQDRHETHQSSRRKESEILRI